MHGELAEHSMIRLSQLVSKNVVNLYDGVRLGAIYEPVVSFDEHTGKLEQLYLGGRNGITGNWSEKNSIVLPWQSLYKIGQEVIIVDLGQSLKGKGKRKSVNFL